MKTTFAFIVCMLTCVNTAKASTYYVDINNATPSPPYTSWGTAANDIQSAVNQTANDDTVLVAEGHYYLTSEIVVTKDITIQSMNGPAETVVDGNGIVRCFNLRDYACVISGLTITKGYASVDGGGIYCTGTTPGITNCTISGNSATRHGGGMFYGTANHCTISGNSAGSWGGGMFRGTAYNCAISGNSAKSGGGMHSSAANNCTISGNEASGWGGGIAGSATVYSVANNCIVWHNRATGGKDIPYFLTIVSYTCSPDVIHGVDGNITNAPLLISASHLATNSPCYGSGNSSSSMGTDIDGEAWFDPPSMGCDEFHGSVTGELLVGIDCNARKVIEGHPISFRSSTIGAVSMQIWNFGDGTMATNIVYPVHTWNSPGTYDVVLTAFNDTYPEGLSATQTIDIATLEDTTVYVAVTGNDLNGGASWLEAKATIQAGVDAQDYAGGLIVVSNGTYLLDSEIRVSKAVVVQGVSGPEATIVDGQGSVRCFKLGYVDCVISGLTITNGYDSYTGGGVYGGGMRSMVSNCTFSGNTSGGEGGAMYIGRADHCKIVGNMAYEGGGLSDCRAYNCTIIGNVASSDGGGGEEVTAYNCLISGNRANRGGGLHNSTANNCIISGNTATGSVYVASGGGLSDSTANNCTIISNTASRGGGMARSSYEGAANNCIIWYNDAASGTNLYFISATNTCSPDVMHGVDGNITNAPMFIDQTNGNYRLLAESACINAGNNLYVAYGADMDAHPRIVNGIVDMGAYESGFNGCFITNCIPSNGKTILRWTAFPMWNSTVSWSTNLVSMPFTNLSSSLAYPINSYTDLVHRAENECFYRVDLEP